MKEVERAESKWRKKKQRKQPERKDGRVSSEDPESKAAVLTLAAQLQNNWRWVKESYWEQLSSLTSLFPFSSTDSWLYLFGHRRF